MHQESPNSIQERSRQREKTYLCRVHLSLDDVENGDVLGGARLLGAPVGRDHDVLGLQEDANIKLTSLMLNLNTILSGCQKPLKNSL